MPSQGVSLDFVSKELTPRPLPAGPAFSQIVGQKLSPPHSPVNGTFVLPNPAAAPARIGPAVKASRGILPTTLPNVPKRIPAKFAVALQGLTNRNNPQRTENRDRAHRRADSRTTRFAGATEAQAGLPTNSSLGHLFCPASFGGCNILCQACSEEKLADPKGLSWPRFFRITPAWPRAVCFFLRRRRNRAGVSYTFFTVAEGWLWAAFRIALRNLSPAAISGQRLPPNLTPPAQAPYHRSNPGAPV